MPAPFSAPACAASAYPAPARAAAVTPRDSPSPTKKRRVEAALPPQAGPSEADPTDPELQRRLYSSTLKLRDAWDDILRRHSLPLPSPASSSRAASAPAPAPARHRAAGRTRAIPMEEDDIIDLATMEIVEDRGVLRRSRRGAFALGGYMDALEDVMVGPDTGHDPDGGEDEVDGEGHGWDADDFDDEDDDDDRSAEYSTSDDELGDMDELPSLPSLQFREQRRRDAERRDQLRDFWAHEARARGASAAETLREKEAAADATSMGGNCTVDAIDEVDEDEDDELSFFARAPTPGSTSPVSTWAGRRRSSSSPLEVEVVTPSRKGKEPSRPPSTTAALRVDVEDVHLASPTSSARAPFTSPPLKPGAACLNCRKRKRRCDALKPACSPCVKSRGDEPCVYDCEYSPSHALSISEPPKMPSSGLATPPTSFAARKASVPPSKAPASRPPLSSSPMREVITIASPSPTPSPSSSPSPSPAPPTQYTARRARSPSLEILPTRPRSISPELGIPAPPACVSHKPAHQRMTPTPTPTPVPTPTPPPFSLPGHGSSSGCGARIHPTTTFAQSRKREWRRHSFELVIEVKPRVHADARPPPAPAARSEKARGVPPSASAPNLAAGAEEGKARAATGERQAEGGAPRPLGLSTPPLSKRAAAWPATARPAPALSSATAAPRMVASSSAPRPASSTAQALPSRILPRAPDAVLDEGEGPVEDPLLLGSSPSTAKRALSMPGSERATAAPALAIASSRRWKCAAEESEEEDDGTVAPPAVPPPTPALAPLHSAQLLQVVVQLSFVCHALAVVSYLLSPSHILVLAVRVALQAQFSTPRTTHPTRSLRFFGALWAAQAIAAFAWHGATGSRGTKGLRGHSQGGIVLDWIGQAATPSTAHLLAIDAVLAVCQLATVLLAFGATVPSDLDASAGGESARDYAALLGAVAGSGVEEEDDTADGDEPASTRRRARRRGYEGVPLRDEDAAEEKQEEDDEELAALEAEADRVGLGLRKPSASSSASALLEPQAQYMRLPLIADIRLRTVWAEVRKSAREVGEERADAGVRGMEEGRGAEAAV
ncbi:hypothetical protein JCM3770_003872 [Rhodotorula araucariae]